ncbi:hypothetical protein J2Y60_003717 [Arcicella sp. BE140]|nr:hypothetical protein [Arcicella sp. BE51]MDR6813505.1 hypothetical protein [Arcicella sp. BE140]MDR6824818.1 hypothetical protein [Arcicella sp. BE139]
MYDVELSFQMLFYFIINRTSEKEANSYILFSNGNASAFVSIGFVS